MGEEEEAGVVVDEMRLGNRARSIVNWKAWCIVQLYQSHLIVDSIEWELEKTYPPKHSGLQMCVEHRWEVPAVDYVCALNNSRCDVCA